MSHYVYSDTAVLVPATTKVFELPEGGWVTFENGQRRNVTQLRDAAEGFGLVNPNLYPTDYSADIKSRIMSIETKVDAILAALLAKSSQPASS